MCDLATGIALASSASGFMGQRAQAKAQANAQGIASMQERERAGQEMRNLRLRQGQQRVQLANEMDEGARRANVAMASAETAIGEAGVSGRAAELVADNIEMQSARYQRSLQRQKSENDFATELQLENSTMRTQMNQQRINQPINEPDFAQFAIGALGSVAAAQTRAANYEMATGDAFTFGNLTGLNIGGTKASASPAPSTYSPAQVALPPLPTGDGTVSNALFI